MSVDRRKSQDTDSPWTGREEGGQVGGAGREQAPGVAGRVQDVAGG